VQVALSGDQLDGSDGTDTKTSREPGPRKLAEPPFVGRAAVMQQLTAAFDAAAAGHGRLCLLRGEAGIGKTRCADEFARLARRRGVRAWIGRCFEHGQVPAFWPYIQVLRAAQTDPILSEQARAELESLLDTFEESASQTMLQQPLVQNGGGRNVRFWLLDRLSRWLASSARSQLRLIIIEDLQYADESSVAALSLLAPLLAQARMLVLVTALDQGFQDSRSLSTLTARVRPCEQFPLYGLRPNEVESWVRAVLGDAYATALAAPLSARTGGNPLFLLELARVALAQYESSGTMQASDLALPAAITDVISARLQALDAATRGVLEAAAVIGSTFSVPLLERVIGSDADSVQARLQAAEGANLVSVRADTVTREFVHASVREVVYRAMSSVERARLHGAVGTALEAQGRAKAELGEVAHHYYHAPVEQYAERAAFYCSSAGDASTRGLAYDLAVRWYARALEALTRAFPSDTPAACDLLLRSAAASAHARHPGDARRECKRAIELATEDALPDVLISAARQLRPSVWLALVPDPLALRALEHALRILDKDALELRAQAQALLAVLPPYSVRRDTMQRMSAEAVRLANAAGSGGLVMLEAQRSRLFALCGPDTIDEALQVADSILAQVPAPIPRWAGDAHLARYIAFMLKGDGRAAERELDACDLLAAHARLPFLAWEVDRLRAQRLLHAGRLNDAERRFDELRAEAGRLQLRLGDFYYSGHRVALGYERTDRRQYDVSQAARDARGAMQALPGYRVQELIVHIQSGDPHLAHQELRALAEADFEVITADPFALAWLVLLASAAVDLGERAVMRTLLTLLEPYAELVAVDYTALSFGSVSRYLGMLELALGHCMNATRYFERASEINARAGHELERLRAVLGLAEARLQSNEAHERAHGRALADEVGVAAESAGALAMVARAHRLATLPGCRAGAPGPHLWASTEPSRQT
jgi:hypothetical protein